MVRAALAQLSSVPGDSEANARRATALLAGHPSVDLAVFPELFLVGYDLSRVEELALPADCEDLRIVAAAAAEARTAVVIGFAERVSPGRVANSAALIGADGVLVGVYRKTHLFGDERRVFVAGDDLLLVRLGETLVAPLVCFDLEFPAPARRLVGGGAQLLVTISANMAPFYEDHLLLARSRALENRVPHLYVNRVGEEGGFRFVGGSRSIGADGAVLSELAHADEDVLVAPVGSPGVDDERLDYLRQDRPGLGLIEP
ncbi:MAG: nitrilase-related carbon-nitrogen hydrolase [Gaiellaceae bacterium]